MHPWSRSRTRPHRLAAPLAALTALVGLLAAGCSSSGSSSTDASSTSRPAPESSAVTSTPSPTPTPKTAAQLRAEATAAVAHLAGKEPHHSISVAALNMDTHRAFSWGPDSGMWTASCYKLYVLETLLLDRQHGDSTGLSDSEVDQATTMIENSDNVAGYSLFLDAGGRSALSATAQRLGMTHTVPGLTDPTFTRTGASDYLHLLTALVQDHPLNAASRAFTLHLMRNVESDQRWGVGVLADPGTTFANKNGWLSIENGNGPGEDDNGLWAVTSAGIVTVHGQRVLMAVMTEHQPSFGVGVHLVQAVARAAAPAVSS